MMVYEYGHAKCLVWSRYCQNASKVDLEDNIAEDDTCDDNDNGAEDDTDDDNDNGVEDDTSDDDDHADAPVVELRVV